MTTLEKATRKAVKKLRKIQENIDSEKAHVDADNVLRELLQELGFEEVVVEFDKIEKWYA